MGPCKMLKFVYKCSFKLILRIYNLSTPYAIGNRIVPQNATDKLGNLGNGLLPSSNKPLLKPMMTNIYVALSPH